MLRGATQATGVSVQLLPLLAGSCMRCCQLQALLLRGLSATAAAVAGLLRQASLAQA
jgi:hypothetical protein